MKPIRAASASGLLALAWALAVQPAAAAPDPAPDPAPAGKLLLEARLRWEGVDRDGVANSAQALTLRTRLGWQSAKFADLVALVEAENVTALGDHYADGVRPKPGYPTVADPELTEINRAQLTWTGLAGTEVVLGRQRIVLNNARFVGNGGWRQNEQTFDGVKATTTALQPLTLTYAWIGRVHRTLGPDHPQGEWRGDVHLMQADAKTAAGQLSAYGYLLDLDNAPAQSSATWGARLTGSHAVSGPVSATWELEYARQKDWGNNPARFDLGYGLVAAGLKMAASSVAFAYERLDGDGARGFQTPLASLHPFQGWADQFTTTPKAGVRDLSLRAATSLTPAWLGQALKFRGEAHDFADADGQTSFGRELDAAVLIALSPHLGLELKGADFHGDQPAYPDTRKLWVTLEYRY